MKTLTISIAAYNVEKTLKKTLDSLNDSRFRDDIEVLIIDDGSKDKTSEVALKYQNEYPNTFRYISKLNGGHGSTINKGIELATGKYFKVLDGDDWVESNNFNMFVEKLKMENTDLILTNFAHVFPEGKIEKINYIKDLESGKKYSMDQSLNITRVEMHMITIKTALLKEGNVRITEKCFYVDQEYNVWSLYLANTIKYIDTVIYMYRFGVSEQSVSKNNMIKNVEMQEKITLNIVSLYSQFLQSNMSENKNKLILSWVCQSIGATIRTYLLMNSSKNRILKLKNKIESISQTTYKEIMNDNFIKIIFFKNGIFISLSKILYRIYAKKYDY